MIINMNDDRMMMEILSGRYLGVPDGHVVYMKYPLTFVLALLYRILPGVDWYGTMLISSMLFVIMLVCVRTWQLSDSCKSREVRVLGALALCVFAMGQEFVSITYTTVAAMTGAAALFWYGTSQGKRTDAVITVLLACLTWCIRDALFYMILPVAALIFLFRELPRESSTRKKFQVPLAVITGVCICYLCNAMAYSSEEWKNYLSYNQDRTSIYDYEDAYYLPGYEEYQDYYEALAMTQEERRMLINYNFVLVEDEIGTEVFQKMLKIRSSYGENPDTGFAIRLKNGGKTFFTSSVTGGYGTVFSAALVLGLVLGIRLLIQKRWRELLCSVVMSGVPLGIFLIMEIRGRMPDRVIYSLSLLLFTTVILLLYWYRMRLFDNDKKKKTVRTATAIMICLLGAAGLWKTAGTIRDNLPTRENNETLKVIQDYCQAHEDQFYLITVGALIEYGYNPTLFLDHTSQLNYLSTGDWIAYSPVTEERLAQAGISSAAKALSEGKNIYLISEDDVNLKFTKEYLEQRAGKPLTLKCEEWINDRYAVYSFSR